MYITEHKRIIGATGLMNNILLEELEELEDDENEENLNNFLNTKIKRTPFNNNIYSHDEDDDDIDTLITRVLIQEDLVKNIHADETYYFIDEEVDEILRKLNIAFSKIKELELELNSSAFDVVENIIKNAGTDFILDEINQYGEVFIKIPCKNYTRLYTRVDLKIKS
jgi:hypothetical protein